MDHSHHVKTPFHHMHHGRNPEGGAGWERARLLRGPRLFPQALGGEGAWTLSEPRTGSGAKLDLVFVASWLVIGLVAAYDTYLSVKFQESLATLEVNPICRWLIAADDGSVSILLGCKFAGTVLALGTILLVYRCQRRMGVTVATVVAALQMLVLMYLVAA